MSGGQPPFAGLRVLDLTRVLAGPYCTLMLADLGCEIVKVENTTTGDDTRSFMATERDGISTYFLTANRSKKSVALDLKAPEGRAALLALADRCDVLVENFRGGVMERLGLGHATLRARNPALIYCAISGYGRDGAHAGRPGYDPVAQAESGLMSMTGEPDGAPMRIGISLVDMVTGMFAAQAISAALYARRDSGEGQLVEVCLYDTAVNMLCNFAGDHLLAGALPGRVGNSNSVTQPVGVYRAADAPFNLAVASERLFRLLCAEVLERPELADDPAFATVPARLRNEAKLDGIMNGVFAGQPRDHWLQRLRRVGIPSGPVLDIAEALASDLTRDRGLIREAAAHERLGAYRVLASPMVLHGTPAAAPVGAPLLGQHTEAVLREIAGFPPARIAAMLASGAARSAGDADAGGKGEEP